MNREIVDESCVACRAADPRSEIHRLRLKIGINCGSRLRLLIKREIDCRSGRRFTGSGSDESCVACRAAYPRSEVYRILLKIGINCGSWLRLLINREIDDASCAVCRAAAPNPIIHGKKIFRFIRIESFSDLSKGKIPDRNF